MLDPVSTTAMASQGGVGGAMGNNTQSVGGGVNQPPSTGHNTLPPNPANLPSSPTVAAMAEAAAFDDRLDTNATVIGPLNPEWLDKKVKKLFEHKGIVFLNNIKDLILVLHIEKKRHIYFDNFKFNLEKILERLEYTREQFVDLCILFGCDYCSTIKGIGPKIAHKEINKYEIR